MKKVCPHTPACVSRLGFGHLDGLGRSGTLPAHLKNVTSPREELSSRDRARAKKKGLSSDVVARQNGTQGFASATKEGVAFPVTETIGDIALVSSSAVDVGTLSCCFAYSVCCARRLVCTFGTNRPSSLRLNKSVRGSQLNGVGVVGRWKSTRGVVHATPSSTTLAVALVLVVAVGGPTVLNVADGHAFFPRFPRAF